jgi:hypothetical protein
MLLYDRIIEDAIGGDNNGEIKLKEKGNNDNSSAWRTSSFKKEVYLSRNSANVNDEAFTSAILYKHDQQPSDCSASLLKSLFI